MSWHAVSRGLASIGLRSCVAAACIGMPSVSQQEPGHQPIRPAALARFESAGSISQDTARAVVSGVASEGACVIGGVLSAAQHSELQRVVQDVWRDYQLLLRAKRDSRFLQGKEVKDGDRTVSTIELRARLRNPGLVEASAGRYHLQFLDNPGLVEEREALQQFQTLWASVVTEMLGEEYFASELQLVLSAPGSEPQMWHADNTCGGVTVVIPLVELNEATGWTQFHLRSHQLWQQRTEEHQGEQPLMTTLTNAFNTRSEMVLAPTGDDVISTGSIVVFDARLLHRGCGNVSQSQRPILVFRYDRVSCPPPGQGGVLGTFLNRTIGTSLDDSAKK